MQGYSFFQRTRLSLSSYLTLERREVLFGYLFIAPWIVGFVCLQLGPILASFTLSLTNWSLIHPPVFIGLNNYRRLSMDPLFFKALQVTVVYTTVTVPTGVAIALLFAVLLNQAIRGISVFRTLFYLPAVVAGVGMAVIWAWMFEPNFGVINWVVSLIGLNGPDWLASPEWALPAFIIMSFWSIGGAIVVFLAGLQGIPQLLYEAAAIDGAGRWASLRCITIPMVSPVILFNTIIMVISSFQTFTYAYVITGGGPGDATLFYVLYLYQNAFRWFEMGYASALAWILFLLILVCTLAILRLSRSYVYYEGMERDR